MTQYAIEAEHLSKKFPQKPSESTEAGKKGWWPFGPRPAQRWFTAVDEVSLHIQAGEVFGLLGPNGAGKSTTIRMLCTLLEPTSGTARIAGYDVVREANQVRQNLGTVLAGERSIYWKLTGRENLEYFAALYHLPPVVAQVRIRELLERMELTTRADDLVEKYSTGMKQRIVIARALLTRPPIILLDEPTLGLDPQAARRVRELVNELKAEGHTILLTTHYMEEADQLSDRIGIIDQGRIIALDTPDKLKQRIGQQDALKLEVAGWQEPLSEQFQALPGVTKLAARYTGADTIWEVNLQSPNSRALLPSLIERLGQHGANVVNLNIARPSLEDVFINLTGKALRD